MDPCSCGERANVGGCSWQLCSFFIALSMQVLRPARLCLQPVYQNEGMQIFR